MPYIKINHNMLTLARQMRGLTQLELSNVSKINQGNLSKIEHGSLRVKKDVLENLTTHLDFPRQFFFRTGQIYQGEPINRRLSKREIEQIYARLNIQLHDLRLLYNAFDSLDASMPILDSFQYDTPKNLAIALRKLFNLPFGKIDNLTELLESAGVIVLHLDVNTDRLTGIKFIADRNIPIIAVNKNISPDRMRMALAAEFGQNIISRFKSIPTESDALEFALEFMVPSQDIEFTRPVTLTHIADQKRYWGVPMSSLLIKAKEMKAITNRQYQYIWTQMGTLKYRKREPVSLDPPFEQPVLIKKIFDKYINEFKYSVEDLLRVFRYDRNILNELWEPYLPANSKKKLLVKI